MVYVVYVNPRCENIWNSSMIYESMKGIKKKEKRKEKNRLGINRYAEIEIKKK